jgi:hypothetical protein
VVFWLEGGGGGGSGGGGVLDESHLAFRYIRHTQYDCKFVDNLEGL